MVEKILIWAIVVSLILKLTSFPIPGALLTINLLLLGGTYMFFSSYTFSVESDASKNKKILALTAGGILFLFSIGYLFKLQYWPRASAILITAIVSAIIFYFFVNTQIRSSKENAPDTTFYKSLWKRSLIFSSLGLALVLTPMDFQLKLQHFNDPELAKLKLQAYQNPDNDQYKQVLDDYLRKKYHSQPSAQ